MNVVPKMQVREIEMHDIALLADYWFQATEEQLKSMGADKHLLPSYQEFCNTLTLQVKYSYQQKRAYAIIWLLNGEPVGHCNTNKIIFGKEAYMHLHLWNAENRQKGMGINFVQQSLSYFFNNLKLKRLYCEPFALNHAPNNLLKRIGFTYVKEYITKPGNINYVQPVKLWLLTLEDFESRIALKKH
jgi:RimJ/RimL family protein N-acetyltransferase